MNNNRINNLDKKKVTRFSIRTYKGYGAASIIVSAFFLLFNHNHIALASEINKDINASTNTTNLNNLNTGVSSQLQSNNTSPNDNSTTVNNALIASNNLNTDTSSGTNKQITKEVLQNTAQQHTQQNNVIESKQNQDIVQKNHINNQAVNVSHRIRKRSVNTNPPPVVNNDPLHSNETNTSIENGHFDNVTGGTLPTGKERVTVVTGVNNWTSLSNDPNPKFPIFITVTAKDYRPHISDASAPYGVVLAKTTDGPNRSVLDPKVSGIYQDISVAPGSELIVKFISGNMTFTGNVSGAQLKISDVTGNQILFNNKINGMGNFPTGKITAMVNIPDNLDRVRITFLPTSNKVSLTSGQANSANGFGTEPANNYYGGVVSNVNVYSGSYIETSLPQTSYTVTANSATANVARGTISIDVENKGHTTAKGVVYKVTLPANSKFISATGAQGSYNQTTNVLTLSIGKIGAGQRQNISYTAEFQASEPKSVNLNGNVTYQTDAPFRGYDRQKTGQHLANTQTVQILMYQTDLQTKINSINQQLNNLNEADYTPESWTALKNKITEGINILNEENNNIDTNQRQNQATINQLTTDLQTLYTQLKERTPASPIVSADEPTASVTIAPQGNTTSMTIKYTDTAGAEQTVTATKANNTWSLNTAVAGIAINNQTGIVTIDHSAVQPSSAVTATAVKGNSDVSGENNAMMPIKEATPPSPIVSADEPTASVTIAPQGDTTSLTIKYTDTAGAEQTVTATKANNNMWSLNAAVAGITINEQTGIVTIDHSVVQPSSAVTATAVKGNSDVSGENNAMMPIKEATPPSPIVSADEPTASVTIAPQGDTTSLTIKYTDTTGAKQAITATKANNNTWSLNTAVAGIVINEQTGIVTIDHSAVQPSSAVTATAAKGNSDVSGENNATMPIKEATPASPIVTTDIYNTIVEITPLGNITLMTIKYIDPTGTNQTVLAKKANNTWSLNTAVAGISVDSQSGIVTVEHNTVQGNSEINVISVNKNSDPSQEANILVIEKMATPQTPAKIKEDTAQHITTVSPSENVNQLIVEIENTDASTYTISAVKDNNLWQLLNNQYPSVQINSMTGEVTIPGEIAQFEGILKATVKNGNSDGNSVTQTLATEEFEDEQLPILYVTVWMDTEGNILKDPVEDAKEPEKAIRVGNFEGYRYIGMQMKDGITRYIFEKLKPSSENMVNQTTGNLNNTQVTKQNEHTVQPVVQSNNQEQSINQNDNTTEKQSEINSNNEQLSNQMQSTKQNHNQENNQHTLVNQHDIHGDKQIPMTVHNNSSEDNQMQSTNQITNQGNKETSTMTNNNESNLIQLIDQSKNQVDKDVQSADQVNDQETNAGHPVDQNKAQANNQLSPTIENNDYDDSQDVTISTENNTDTTNTTSENSSQHDKDSFDTFEGNTEDHNYNSVPSSNNIVTEHAAGKDNKSDVSFNGNASVQNEVMTNSSNNIAAENTTPQNDKVNEILIATSKPDSGLNAVKQDLPVLHATVWVDTKGKILKDPIDNDKHSKSERQAGIISGYRFIETKIDNGITRHIFEKISKIKQQRQRTKSMPSSEKMQQSITKTKENKQETLENQNVLKVNKDNSPLFSPVDKDRKHSDNQEHQVKLDELPQTGDLNANNNKLFYSLMSLLGLSLVIRRKNKYSQQSKSVKSNDI